MAAASDFLPPSVSAPFPPLWLAATDYRMGIFVLSAQLGLLVKEGTASDDTIKPLALGDLPELRRKTEAVSRFLGEQIAAHLETLRPLFAPLPGTKVHDLSGVRAENSRNAPRVLQEVEGDFTATVKVTCALEPARQEKNNSFNGAGLLVWESDKNFMRLERNVWVTPDGQHVSYAPLFEYWNNNQCNTLKGGTTTPYFKGASTYLRITRAGDEFKTAVSHDGSKWMETDSATATMPKKVKVGVAAINSAPNAFTVEFSDLKLDKRK